MASYEKTCAAAPLSNYHQMPVLAQARPAIISTSENNYNNLKAANVLSDKLEESLKFSSSVKNHHNITQQLNNKQQYDVKDLRVKFISDDKIIHNQNASNQMRQAAVLAAAACQQKVRLSATERLALTAKKPVLKQAQVNGLPTTNLSHHYHQQSQQPTPVTKQASPLPTLETLLAVQRQLQQHTRQNLNSNNNQQHSLQKPPVPRNKPLPPSPPKSPQLCTISTIADAYDKDLPPLPPSVSPSTLTDDSRMNSLDSQQSFSPATSLVSIPPPPPPLSSYLEQYDEVNNCPQQLSNPTTPSSVSSTSDVSSVRHFPLPQTKIPFPPVPAPPPPPTKKANNCQQATNYEFPLPKPYQQKQDNTEDTTREPSPSALKQPSHIPNVSYTSAYSLTLKKSDLQNSKYQAPSPVESTGNTLNNLHQKHAQSQQQQPLMVPPKPTNYLNNNNNNVVPNVSAINNCSSYTPKLQSYEQHLFRISTDDKTQNVIEFPTAMPPPPPPSMLPAATLSTPTTSLPDPFCNQAKSAGLDEIDAGSGGIRFPTPPPLDLLLGEEDEFKEVEKEEEDDDDDDDFECRIPTPPPHKSMSTTTTTNNTFPSSHCLKEEQLLACYFSSSTFSVPNAGTGGSALSLQPPPLFRQKNGQSPPQLTVNTNSEGGLLSTASSNTRNNANHHHHLHHHNMILGIPASSSSPSSSSDGDGHSSNSSSSTSGIHSSIDSPSSSNSKLDDFNYDKLANKKSELHHHKMLLVAQHHHRALEEQKSMKTGSNGGATPVPGQTVTNIRRPALKQKKSVSFSDKVELVACADEQSEDHLPNPLLARVLSGKLH